MIALLIAVLFASGDAPARVSVTGGVVEGSVAPGGGALLFRGIPYAAPPVGELRWRRPMAVRAWRGVRADNGDAPACPQNDQGWNHGDASRASEDCLTLDIRTPALGGRLPVMVWIHGGSNFSGSNRGTVQSRITDKGVVLVSIQYRLGLLGFLAHRGAAAEAGGHAGNYGLMDQIAALGWIRDNIATFGGDPANVTIFGESAGAQDVSLLLAAPAARGLFAKAIMESGTPGFGMPPRPLANALELGDQAQHLLGAKSLVEMRGRPLAELLAADLKLVDPSLLSNDFRWLRSTIDGLVIPRAPRELLAEAPPRPVIIGSNRVEFGPSPGEVDWNRQLTHIFGANAAKAREFYRAADPRMGHPELQFWTDWIFRCPAGRVAQLLAARGAEVYRYEFDVVEGEGLTSHSAEIAWVLGGKTLMNGDKNVSLSDYWVNFATNGDPHRRGMMGWPTFEPVNQRYLMFNAQGVMMDEYLREPVCSMLEEL
ncbi:MAG: carboxylesterase family protein [Pseudomonadota bacterium]